MDNERLVNLLIHLVHTKKKNRENQQESEYDHPYVQGKRSVDIAQSKHWPRGPWQVNEASVEERVTHVKVHLEDVDMAPIGYLHLALL